MDGTVRFEVRSSSSDEVYVLKAAKTRGQFSFTCTCQAGLNGLLCKHRTNLLCGDVTMLRGKDVSGVAHLAQMVSGTPLEGELISLLEMERALEELKVRIAGLKKVVARRMFGA